MDIQQYISNVLQFFNKIKSNILFKINCNQYINFCRTKFNILFKINCDQYINIILQNFIKTKSFIFKYIFRQNKINYEPYIDGIQRNYYDKMKSLIKLTEQDIDNIPDVNNKIYLTVYYNLIDKFKTFDINHLINSKCSCYNTNIYTFAIQCGNYEICKYLEEINFNIENEDKLRLLCFGAANMNFEIIKYIKKIGFNNDKKYNLSYNAFHCAIKPKLINKIYYYYEYFVSQNVKHDEQIKMMKYLEEIGLNIHGENAYMFAAKNGYLKIMKFLETTELNICATDFNGNWKLDSF
jgi:hypothetical protein